jgi:sigma-B regulation protein RsbU (phosphoserine phosphatase)
MTEATKINPVTTSAPPSDNLTQDTTAQLKMAGHVQRAFLPSQLPNSDKLRWAALYKPADWVSGDIYDVARLDEQHIGFYIADAVGHSMPAALLTMFLKQALVMRQTTGDDYHIFGPQEVVKNLNLKMLEQHLGASLFATCCYCLINIRTMQFTYARAGHPYPILIKKNKQPKQLKIHGGLLGVFEKSHFDQETVQLESGDKLFIYSDGCDPLIGEFNSITELPADQMIAEFESMVNNRIIPPEEIDDVTALMLEIL